MSPKILILYFLRAIGVFALAQHLTRKRLRILCYHGFSIGDEYQVAPFMFMRAATFEGRMKVLQRRGVAVISLDEAVRKLKAGKIDRAETVITLDDGWSSNLTIGLPILKKYGYPACIYITTEHLTAHTEVFNVVLGYMIKRSKAQTLNLKGVHPKIDGSYAIQTDYLKTVMTLIQAAEETFPAQERLQLLPPIAKALGVELNEILRDNRFRLMTREQIIEVYKNGLDIQLHTHTHRLPNHDFESMAYEIHENRKAIIDVLGIDKKHFCYPSGLYDPNHPEWLEKLGIESATTCDTGMNPAGTPVLLLKRYLDREDFHDIEFESEIAGVREIIRTLRLKLRLTSDSAMTHPTTTLT